ncbi:MAG: Fic family protein [Bacilli bacterium]|jgi:Fic family protein|nr:Fic family protein [Bacilli bacterium]MDY0209359.1 Fic family protein [Bacilli bacterium]
MIAFDLSSMHSEASKKITIDFLVDFVYNSISFETSVVSLDEVSRIINGDVSNIEKTKITIINNNLNGFLFMLDLLEKEEAFTENKLKDLHEIIMKDLGIGGLYRNVDISVKGSNHTPPSHIKVYDRMKKYFDTINNPTDNVEEQIAFSHLQLMKIHPFLDGNGRCARIVLNYQLLKNNFSPIILDYSKKDEYFTCLEEFKVNKNILPFIDFIKIKG